MAGNSRDIELTDEFRNALHQVTKNRRSLFVTGRAGTGKSTLLRQIRNITGPNTAVVAPTGIAAINIGGQTIHSFFKFAPRLMKPEDVRPSRRAALYRKLEFLVIDEVSMVRVDLMDTIDRALRVNRGQPGKPFGGVCVVMFGDLHQLPPIVADSEIGRYLFDRYGGAYFFNAPVFKQSRFGYLELTKKFRQTEAEFANLLDCIADRTVDEFQLDALNDLVMPFDKLRDREKFVILAPDNNTVFNLNSNFLNALPGQEQIFEAEVKGQFEESSFPTDPTLCLKVGAKVVLLRNDAAKRWVNGTIAVIAKIADGKVWVEVSGVQHEIERTAWEKVSHEYDEKKQTIVPKVVGSFHQLPLRLAWALTIHKSQGMTLDKVYLDLARGAFAHGQTYVALSRCRSLDGLALAQPLRSSDIIFDPSATGYREALDSAG